MDMAHGAQLLKQCGVEISAMVSDDRLRYSKSADDVLKYEFGSCEGSGIGDSASDGEFGEIVDGDEKVLVSGRRYFERPCSVNSNQNPRRCDVDRLKRGPRC